MAVLTETFPTFSILLIFFTAFHISPVSVTKISSKIDLDDDDVTTPPATLSSSALKAFVDIDQGDGEVVSSLSRITAKQPPRGFGELVEKPDDNSQVNRDRGSDYINIEDLFKGQKRQEIRQNPFAVEGFYRESDVRPTIINNIHVTINANDTSNDVNGCKNGLCDVRVTSKPDSEGNVITNIHLSVVTKIKKSPQVQVADIPVIDGTADPSNPPYDQIPAFHFIDDNVRHGGGPLFDNNIPQIPIHRQDIDTWFHQPPSNIFQRPRPVWHYGRNLQLDRNFAEPRFSHREFKGWTDLRNREGIVDDKIETPLSKTNPDIATN